MENLQFTVLVVTTAVFFILAGVVVIWRQLSKNSPAQQIWDYCEHSRNVRHWNLLVHNSHESYEDFKLRLKQELIMYYKLPEYIAQGCVSNLLNKEWFNENLNNYQGFGDGYEND